MFGCLENLWEGNETIEKGMIESMEAKFGEVGRSFYKGVNSYRLYSMKGIQSIIIYNWRSMLFMHIMSPWVVLHGTRINCNLRVKLLYLFPANKDMWRAFLADCTMVESVRDYCSVADRQLVGFDQ